MAQTALYPDGIAWRAPADARAGTRAIDFRRVVGEAGWRRLAPSIRRRFAASHAGAAATYDGTMHAVHCSRAGLLLATLGRIFGTPLAPFRQTNVPVTVTVRENGDGGVTWERLYRPAGRPPVLISSTKIWDARLGTFEQVGGGFGMTLSVFERHGSLHFVSRRYFFAIGRLRVPLPGLLMPGTLEVVHAGAGPDRFRFTMTIRHPVLGVTFYQDGIFRDEGDLP